MAPFIKKSPHAQVSIHLDSRSRRDLYHPEVNRFTTNETINGYALVNLPPGNNFSSCKVALKGVVRTTTWERNTGAFSKDARRERLPFLGAVLERKARNCTQDQQGRIRVPFRFKLADCEQLSTFRSGLPPSLDSRVEGRSRSDDQYEVEYNIVATVFSSGSTLATATQEVAILPVSSDALSDSNSDVPGEYFWAVSHSNARPKNGSRTPSFTHKPAHATPPPPGPRLELAGLEPNPILFDVDEPSGDGLTEIPFVVKLSHDSAEAAEREALPARCEVKANLVTKTHITPNGLRRLSSHLEFTPDDGPHVTKSNTSHEQTFDVPVGRWESCITSTTDPFSVARFSVAFAIQNESLLAPTFYTPLLSRKYFIDLSLTFPEHPEMSYKLTMPVQVVHGTQDEFELVADDRKHVDVSCATPPEMVEAHL